jgi:hypothetical protein
MRLLSLLLASCLAQAVEPRPALPPETEIA